MYNMELPKKGTVNLAELRADWLLLEVTGPRFLSQNGSEFCGKIEDFKKGDMP